jgi:hypothetical protein
MVAKRKDPIPLSGIEMSSLKLVTEFISLQPSTKLDFDIRGRKSCVFYLDTIKQYLLTYSLTP